MDFEERLRLLRKRKKLSQGELGKLVDVHYIQVGKYERGLARPSYEVLIKMAEVLGVSVDYLIDGKSGQPKDEHICDRELWEQFKKIERLGEEERKVVKIFLDAFLMRKRLQEIVK